VPNYYQSKQVASRLPFAETDGTGTIYSGTGEFLVPAAGFTAGDIIEMTGVPAYHVLEVVTALGDVVDSNGTPTLTVDVGYITGAPFDLDGLKAGTRTFTADFLTASTTPFRAGGTQASSSINLGPADRQPGVALGRLPHRRGARHAGGRRPDAPAGELLVGLRRPHLSAQWPSAKPPRNPSCFPKSAVGGAHRTRSSRSALRWRRPRNVLRRRWVTRLPACRRPTLPTPLQTLRATLAALSGPPEPDVKPILPPAPPPPPPAPAPAPAARAECDVSDHERERPQRPPQAVGPGVA
jgi:hypothetical protein